MSAYIDTHRDQYGVEPICRTLGVAPSTYYAARSRPPSARALRDAAMKPHVTRVYDSNYRVYGRHKVWRQLRREGVAVGRDQVGRLMRELGIAGVVRGKVKRTTISDPRTERAPDLVDRRFVAERPNRLWVADFTYVPTWEGMVYVAFVFDVFSRRVVGWRAATSMTTQLVLDTLEHAIWTRRTAGVTDLTGLVHHNDAGSQYTSFAFTSSLIEAGVDASVGSVGDAYDNALAESAIGIYKTELIRPEGPWRDVDHVELETLKWVHWFNHERTHESIDDLTPIEVEQAHYAAQNRLRPTG